MLLLFHGDNIVQSRNRLHEEINKASQLGVKEVIRFDGKKINLTDLEQALSSQSLFGSQRLIVVESLHANLSKKILNEAISNISKLKPETCNLILWHAKVLTPAQLKKLSNFTPVIYKTSPQVFNFLDSIQPNKLPNFNQLDQIFKQDSPEFFFHMLTRQTRLMIQSIDGKPAAPPFQIPRLKKQAQALGASKLLQLHKELLDLDYRSKTGQVPLNFGFEIERLLIKLITS